MAGQLTPEQYNRLVAFAQTSQAPACILAGRLGLPQDIGADAVHDCVLKLLQKPSRIGQYHAGQLRRAVHNQLLDYLRARGQLEQLPPQLATEVNLEDSLLEEEYLAILERIATERERQILECYLDDPNFTRIGRQLGISQQATNRSFHRLIERARLDVVKGR